MGLYLELELAFMVLWKWEMYFLFVYRSFMISRASSAS